MSAVVQDAYFLAKAAHNGQTRRNGEDYFTAHVEPVAKYVMMEWYSLLPSSAYETWNRHKNLVVAAAYLHDVLEDTKYKINSFPVMVQELVHIVTKQPGENYFDFIMRIQDSGPFSVAAKAIKLADLHNNLSTLEEGSMKDKYRFAQYILRPRN